MTNKTRIRLVRVAASAVIIAGASLTAAGAAQAVGGFGPDNNQTQGAEVGTQSEGDTDGGNTILGGISGSTGSNGTEGSNSSSEGTSEGTNGSSEGTDSSATAGAGTCAATAPSS
ncbi:hypothetical protein ACFU8I_18970, partial [Streptomyces sp. NPDC057540]